MLGQYLPIVALLVLAFLFAALSFVASKLLAPSRPTAAKLSPYECGIVPGTDNPKRFPVRFFLVAMIFIVFDIEIIFMYPWSMIYRELGGYGLIVMGIFSFAVFESFVYLISNGALDWGPIKQVRTSPEQVSSSRTMDTTIRRVSTTGVRRVGTEGREAA